MRARSGDERGVGTVIDGKWRIDRLLGRGATSAVYEVTHRNGVRAALKILHPQLCADPATCARFLREASLANAVKHRAVATVRDDGITEDGCAYLVLDLLEGKTLEAWRVARGGRVSVEEVAPIADELMSALSAVHAAGVVHRDLGPKNVHVTTTGDLKIFDFGTASLFEGGKNPSVGLLAAAPVSPYAAPERAQGTAGGVDAQSDVWSLGAMLFVMLAGEPPLGPKGQLRSLGEIAPELPPAVITVVDRALATDKLARWSDVRSMRAAFRRAAGPCTAMRARALTMLPTDEVAPVSDHRSSSAPTVVVVSLPPEPPRSSRPEEMPEFSPAIARLLRGRLPIAVVLGLIAGIVLPATVFAVGLASREVPRVAAEPPPSAVDVDVRSTLGAPATPMTEVTPVDSWDASVSAPPPAPAARPRGMPDWPFRTRISRTADGPQRPH